MIDFQELIDDFVDNTTFTKARRIYKTCHIDYKNSADNIFEFSCQSESHPRKFYDVEIDYSDEDIPEVFCSCPQHDTEEYCKHITACLLFLIDNAEGTPKKAAPKVTAGRPKPGSVKSTALTQVYNMSYLYEWEIFKGLTAVKQRMITGSVVKQNLVTIQSETEQKSLTATVNDNGTTQTVQLKKLPGEVLAECTCGHVKTPCIHTRSVLYYILKTKKNSHYLDTLTNHDTEKAELLATVNLLPTDEQSGLFEFYFEGEELKMKSKVNILMNVKQWNTGNMLQGKLAEKKKLQFAIPNQLAEDFIFILKLHKETPIIRWDVYPITGTPERINALGTKLNTTDKDELKRAIPQFADFVHGYTPTGLVQHLRENGITSYHYYNPAYELSNLTAEKFTLVKNFLTGLFRKNMEALAASRHFFTGRNKISKPKPTDLQPLRFSPEYFQIHLQVRPNGKFVFITAMVKIGEAVFPLNGFDNCASIMLLKNGVAYIAAGESTWQLLQDFSTSDQLILPISEAQKLYRDYLLPFRNEISIDLPEEIMPVTITPVQCTLAVRLKEMEPNFLLLQPIIKYDSTEAELDGEAIETFAGNQLQVIERDDEKEKYLRNTIQNLHPNFANQHQQTFFYLSFANALAGGWFFDALKTLAENNIDVYGQKQLTKFKYNANKPKLEIRGGSGIDWFDLKIEVSYGEQIVPLKALKQAILNKQDFVQLGDGTMGLLPQEWLKKFRALFQLGNIKNESELQVSKLHYTLIDELHGAITDKAILQELALKKKQLDQLHSIQPIAVPKNIKATLRPYQLAGLNWLHQLHQIGWGGCLADDMGLGKTLQTLCYLQHLYNQNKKVRALIVCPTSLIYNWQAELDKFTSVIGYIVYHGLERAFPKDKDGSWNLIITSYGTLRNDIEKFSKITFDVAVLDESQSIKNPVSQVTKAVALINTRMRFILSGTPVQNNTFDLYAQLNFCNPGLLGNQDFFKSEFATAIDKYGDKDKSAQLRKMVFPFILRRTKEQVAKDLPDKTETILYCEMGSYQQKVYDTVKEEFRFKILNSIAENGMAKSTFQILQGLNQLRLICDCPSLIGDEEQKRFKQESIKLDELMREIEENISNHKMLIFSQFLGMLNLVKGKLDKDGIKYIYLDGSTPAKDRARLVNEFQTDSSIQIFLISLKAGGVGLNLTAADYVYVIDPWWNPAVEDQAIDRTHRIGQHKKIFAYKLICKNSIEEKILLLQQKKKSLAKELITEDASFVKKLTKEDVAWLLN